MLVATALSVIFIRDLFAVIMVFSVYSLLSAGFFLNLDAPDVALTEAAIGAGISPILMLATLALTRRFSGTTPREKKPVHSALLPVLAVTITGAALIYATLDMPHFADPQAPVHGHVAPRYLNESAQEIGIPNVVTSVLASYRGFDTLGEVFVIFTAGLGVMALLGFVPARDQEAGWQLADMANLRGHLVLHVIAKILIPVILLYALYVQFHGDYSPGGGFQAGVIFAAGFILYAMIYGLRGAYQVVAPRLLLVAMAAGVLLYAGTGLVSLLREGNYLDYDVLAGDPVAGQHLGIILVELGVGICVAAVMMAIFFSFAEGNNHATDNPPGKHPQ